MGCEGVHDVEAGGKHRLQDVTGDGLGLVLRLFRNAGDHGRRDEVPGTEVLVIAVAGEQVAVEREVHDRRHDRPLLGRAGCPETASVLVTDRAADSEVALAVLLRDFAETGDPLAG